MCCEIVEQEVVNCYQNNLPRIIYNTFRVQKQRITSLIRIKIHFYLDVSPQPQAKAMRPQ